MRAVGPAPSQRACCPHIRSRPEETGKSKARPAVHIHIRRSTAKIPSLGNHIHSPCRPSPTRRCGSLAFNLKRPLSPRAHCPEFSRETLAPRPAAETALTSNVISPKTASTTNQFLLNMISASVDKYPFHLNYQHNRGGRNFKKIPSKGRIADFQGCFPGREPWTSRAASSSGVVGGLFAPGTEGTSKTTFPSSSLGIRCSQPRTASSPKPKSMVMRRRIVSPTKDVYTSGPNRFRFACGYLIVSGRAKRSQGRQGLFSGFAR